MIAGLFLEALSFRHRAPSEVYVSVPVLAEVDPAPFWRNMWQECLELYIGATLMCVKNVCVYIYIYLYLHIHMYLYIHAYIHIYTHSTHIKE